MNDERERSGPTGTDPYAHVSGDDPTLMDVNDPESSPIQGATTWPGSLQDLAGRYQLEEPIASGGAAIVWRAFDEVLSRSVALKLLHPHLASDPDTVERFRREAIAAARLTHPNAVAIYDTGQERDVVYLVMEYVDGPSLRDLLMEHGPMDPGIVAALGEQVASALGEAHAQGLVHRDVKPGNILLTRDGVAKVTDFGIAKALSGSESTLTTPGTVVGTAAYVAPEQLQGDDVDARADVYALGVVLYECLTGQPAFQGDTPTATAAARLHNDLRAPRQIRADVPRVLDEIIVRCTRRNRDLRFPDGSSLAAAMAPLVRARPSDVTAALVSDAPPVPPRAGRGDDDTGPVPSVTAPRGQGRKLLTAFIGGLVLALVAFFATEALRSSEDPPEDTITGEVLPIERAQDFDPFDETVGAENPDDVVMAFDDDPQTAWQTDTYHTSPNFGGTRPGVGVWFDLGAPPPQVANIALTFLQGGAQLEIYTANSLPERVDKLNGWGEPVLTLDEPVDGDRAVLSVGDGEPTEGRYWLLWFTSLPMVGEDAYRVALSDVQFLTP